MHNLETPVTYFFIGKVNIYGKSWHNFCSINSNTNSYGCTNQSKLKNESAKHNRVWLYQNDSMNPL